ncbi:MAG TPA: DUF6461 domain-containing protein [Acidimicrobiia bacterium]|nr:DUF6461 domain-containing protein [Acidimicrobiia bacterium]
MTSAGEPLAEVVDALVPAVVAGMAEVVRAVPAGPAAVLGRLGVAVDPMEERERILRRVPGEQHIAPEQAWKGQSDVANALDRLPALLVERLLGALERTVTDLVLDPPPPAAALAELAGPPPPGERFAMLSSSSQSEARTALSSVERRPGVTPLVEAVTRALATRPEVAARLRIGPDVSEEEAIIARHGAGYVALAAVTATAVLRATAPDGRPDPAGVVGVALGVAVRLLQDAHLPAHYADAQLARRRAEYLLPLHATGWAVAARDHQLFLVEGTPPAAVDFSANGLVAPVADGLVVRTGTPEGSVNVELRVTEEPPPEVELVGWDEVVEVSWTAPAGSAAFVGSGMGARTPPWPGEYRVRVNARGRDRADGREHFRLHVWPAPVAPQTVHKQSDLLGFRLRGEQVPVRPEPPEAPHLWITDSSLGVAATITVVTGATIDDVVHGFGADPARSMSMRMRRQIYDIDPPWIAVTTVDGGVVAVEDNGWEGRTAPVLEALSRSGRAASMFWNVNAVTRLSFAQSGTLLASFEPGAGMDRDLQPEVTEALQGIDFDDYRDTVPKGLAAVFRFTGAVFRKDDLERLEAADLAYPISR